MTSRTLPCCPSCGSNRISARGINGYFLHCRECTRDFKLTKAGSGQIAGPTFRHQQARDTLKRLERGRGKS